MKEMLSIILRDLHFSSAVVHQVCIFMVSCFSLDASAKLIFAMIFTQNSSGDLGYLLIVRGKVQNNKNNFFSCSSNLFPTNPAIAVSDMGWSCRGLKIACPLAWLGLVGLSSVFPMPDSPCSDWNQHFKPARQKMFFSWWFECPFNIAKYIF